MLDTSLKTHPLYGPLVPILVAAPPGWPGVVRVHFSGGQPTHIVPDYPLPPSPHGGLYALPFPRLVPDHILHIVAEVERRLDIIWEMRATGELLIRHGGDGQPVGGVAWQGVVPVRPLKRPLPMGRR